MSQLETGKIKQPSPLTLYKLASLYEVSYETFMEKVGYPVPQSENVIKFKKGENVIFHRIGKLSQDEELELLEYLKFIRNRRK